MTEHTGPENEHEEFSAHVASPETVPVPTDQDKLVDLVIDLVDSSGTDDSTGELKSAVFYVPDNDTNDGRYPSLKINVPNEGYSEKYQWRAELTFGNQDPSLSTHVLVRKDGSIVTTDYAGGSDRILDESQLTGFLAYLEQIKGNLIQDN